MWALTFQVVSNFYIQIYEDYCYVSMYLYNYIYGEDAIEEYRLYHPSYHPSLKSVEDIKVRVFGHYIHDHIPHIMWGCQPMAIEALWMSCICLVAIVILTQYTFKA